MSSASSISMRRALVIVLVAFVVISTLQAEPPMAEADKSDLLFVKGKFIKKDKKGVIVVDDKCHSCCHKGRR